MTDVFKLLNYQIIYYLICEYENYNNISYLIQCELVGKSMRIADFPHPTPKFCVDGLINNVCIITCREIL